MENRQYFKNFIWNIVGTSVNSFMSLVYQIIVTRINGLEANGVFSVCFSLSMLIYTFSSLGGRIFEVSDKRGNDNTYYTLKFVTNAISLIFAFAIAVFCGYDTEKILLLMFLMLVRCVEAFSDTVYAVLQKAERLDLVGMSYVIKNTVALAAFTAVDVISKNFVFSAMAMFFATGAAYFIFDISVCKRYQRLKADRSVNSCFLLARRVAYFVAFNLVVMLIANLPKLVADFRYTDGEMGYFGILMMIPSIMILLGQMIVQQYLTRITDYYSEGDFACIKKTTFKIFCAIIVFSVFCGGAAYYFGAPVLNIVYGLDFQPYRMAMLVSVLAGTFNVLVTVLSAVLTVMNRSRQQLYMYISVAVVEAVILYFGLSSSNFISAFFVYLITTAVQFAVFATYYLGVLRRDENEFKCKYSGTGI